MSAGASRLEATGLQKSYGPRKVVKSVSLAVEKGEVVGPIKDLRFDESLFEALGPKLLALTSRQEIHPETGTYGSRDLGGMKVPGALIEDFTFTL